MRANLTVDFQLPASIVERLTDTFEDELCIDHFYDDAEASAFMRNMADKAKVSLDAAGRKLGLSNDSVDIQYGFSGTRGKWRSWYQRVYN